MCPAQSMALKGYREKRQTTEILQEARLVGKTGFSHVRRLESALAQVTRIWWEWEMGVGYSDREGFHREVSMKVWGESRGGDWLRSQSP